MTAPLQIESTLDADAVQESRDQSWDWLAPDPSIRDQVVRELDHEEYIQRLVILSSYHEHQCIACGDVSECLTDCDGAIGQVCRECVVK